MKRFLFVLCFVFVGFCGFSQTCDVPVIVNTSNGYNYVQAVFQANGTFKMRYRLNGSNDAWIESAVFGPYSSSGYTGINSAFDLPTGNTYELQLKRICAGNIES